MSFPHEDFEELHERGQLTLSLVGMSNIGKTYWSRKLSAADFHHINCDDLVENKITDLLGSEGYSRGIVEVAHWMGMPYDERYEVNQKTFLEVECEVMNGLFNRAPFHGNTVIDTTGSIVHTGDEVCSNLKKHSLVIYLAATQDHMEEMYQKYLVQPKPVVFENFYDPQSSESQDEALGRCYRELLTARSDLYARYADVTLLQDDIWSMSTVEEFLSLVASQIPAS